MTQFLDTAPVDISLSDVVAWTDIDLSERIPASATEAIIQMAKTGGIWTNDHCFIIVNMDESRKCESYIDDIKVNFYLVGYAEGDATLFDNAYDESLTNTLIVGVVDDQN